MEDKARYICVHCGHIVLRLCDSRHCNANRRVDPYCEHDLPVILLDLILVKPAAFRHLLFNANHFTKLPSSTSALRTARRALALLLVDAYIRWHHLCISSLPSGNANADMLNLIFSYTRVLAVVAMDMAALHLVVLTLSSAFLFARKRIARRQKSSAKAAAPPADAEDASPWSADVTNPLKAPHDELSKDAERLRPHQLHAALLLANTPTLLLLSLLLLWRTRSTRSLAASTPTPGADEDPLVKLLRFLGTMDDDEHSSRDSRDESVAHSAAAEWATRTLVGGLSSGVALGVVLPRAPVVTTSILLSAWAAQAAVKYTLHTELGQGEWTRSSVDRLCALHR